MRSTDGITNRHQDIEINVKTSSTDYAQAYPVEYRPDARQRGRVSINHVLPPSRDIARRRAGIPADLVFSAILTKSLLALSHHLVKEWLINGIGIPLGQINLGLLILAAIVLGAWQRPWELHGARLKVHF